MTSTLPPVQEKLNPKLNLPKSQWWRCMRVCVCVSGSLSWSCLSTGTDIRQLRYEVQRVWVKVISEWLWWSHRISTRPSRQRHPSTNCLFLNFYSLCAAQSMFWANVSYSCAVLWPCLNHIHQTVTANKALSKSVTKRKNKLTGLARIYKTFHVKKKKEKPTFQGLT